MRVQGGRMVPANTQQSTDAINKIAAAIRAVNDALREVADAGAGVPVRANDRLSKAMRAIEDAYGKLQPAQQNMMQFRHEASGGR